MPELSRFYGIVIKMYFDDHDPSHFHAEYAEDEAVISIETLAVIAGRLRPSALGDPFPRSIPDFARVQSPGSIGTL